MPTSFTIGQRVSLLADPAHRSDIVELFDDETAELTNGLIYPLRELVAAPEPGIKWMELPEAEGFRLSNTGKAITPNYRNSGRERLVRGLDGKWARLAVYLPGGAVSTAQLVARHFLPPPPIVGKAYRVRHLDRDKHNARADNLAWFDLKETKDPEVLAHLRRGRQYGMRTAKLTSEQADLIAAELREGVEHKDLAQRYNVSREAITQLAKHRGISRRPRLTTARRTALLDKLAQGVSPTELAREYGVSRLSVYRWQAEAQGAAG